MVRDLIEYSFILIAFCIIILAIVTKQTKETDELIDVVVAKHEIEEGKILEETDFVYNDIPKQYLPDNYIKSIRELLGKSSKVTIDNNTIMNNYYVGNGKEDKYESNIMYNNITLQDDLKSEDIVDIRIKVNEIEDYLILSDKTIIERTDNKIWLSLSLEEQEELLKVIERIGTGCVVYAEKKGGLEN